MSIDTILSSVIGREGAYSNNSADTGGETMWGVTVAVARANGYYGPMRDMPRSTAVSIYRHRYVIAPGFDIIAAMNGAIGEEMIDTGINMGVAVAGMFLQRALSAFNNGGKDYADLKQDGEIGPASRAALKAFLDKRGEEGAAVLLRALNALQGERYIEIAEKRPANEAFVYGWFRTRVA